MDKESRWLLEALTGHQARQAGRESRRSKPKRPLQMNDAEALEQPSIARIILKNAQARHLQDVHKKLKEDGNPALDMSPMIASLLQLDR